MELLSKKVTHHSSHGRRTRDDNRARKPFMRAGTAPTANSSNDSHRNRLFSTRARWHKKEENDERKGTPVVGQGKQNGKGRKAKIYRASSSKKCNSTTTTTTTPTYTRLRIGENDNFHSSSHQQKRKKEPKCLFAYIFSRTGKSSSYYFHFFSAP